MRRWFTFHGAHVPAGLCVSMQDVTDRVELERSLRNRASELAEANRGKEDFLLQLAHELRNCLAPVRTALHLWSSHDGGNTQESEARQMALDELQRISRLLEDLLKLSRLAPTDSPPKLARLDLTEVAAHSVNALLATPAARGRRFAVHLPAEPLPIEGDRDMLDKVLAHLLDNAVKFTRVGGNITVEVSRDDDDALLRVRDDGIGIAPEALPGLFNLFMRPDRPGGRLQGGVGVGLALVRRIVELHAGRVEAHSEGTDRGSEFVVRLPRCPKAARRAPISRRCACSSSTTTGTPPRAWRSCCVSGVTRCVWRTIRTRPWKTPAHTRRTWCSWTSVCRGWTATRWPGTCASGSLARTRCWWRSPAMARPTTAVGRWRRLRLSHRQACRPQRAARTLEGGGALDHFSATAS